MSAQTHFQTGTYMGIMSGTSLDGVDIAIVDFYENIKLKYSLIDFVSYNYPQDLKNDVLNLYEKNVSIAVVSEINMKLSKLYAECINNTLAKHKELNIKAVGLHGQTVWHSDGEQKHTLQLGSSSYVSTLTGLKVIGDFRNSDIAVGGNGAPLVPIFDYYFFSSLKENIITLNIGGIANITYLPANCNKSDVIAFDTGPGNILIDAAMNKLFEHAYDHQGLIAKSGQIIQELLNKLLNLEFIKQKPPKSTGRELFNLSLFDKYFSTTKSEDIIRTLTEYSAKTIALNIKSYTSENSTIIVSGGGSKNSFLLELLKSELPTCNIILSDEIGLHSQTKEAIAFAFMAMLNLSDIPGNIKSVTGADKEVVLGNISK